MRKLIFSLGLTSVAALAASTSTAPTYYKDALPVLQKNCQGCHRPGEAAPMSFLTYEQTRPWAKGIRAAVLTKKMPPWFADAHYGKFTNDRSLNQKEIDTLVAWADGGAKEGKTEKAITKISQETLAQMVGTTRSRVSFFMNKFRKLGFVHYNGGLEVHSSLLNVILHSTEGRERKG